MEFCGRCVNAVAGSRNVVDMFKFQAEWPSWVPWLGGSEVFPAIWNMADASITIGVIMVFLRQRRYFPKKTSEDTEESTSETEVPETPITEAQAE